MIRPLLQLDFIIETNSFDVLLLLPKTLIPCLPFSDIVRQLRHMEKKYNNKHSLIIQLKCRANRLQHSSDVLYCRSKFEYRTVPFLSIVVIHWDWLLSSVGHITELKRWQMSFSKLPLVSETTWTRKSCASRLWQRYHLRWLRVCRGHLLCCHLHW